MDDIRYGKIYKKIKPKNHIMPFEYLIPIKRLADKILICTAVDQEHEYHCTTIELLRHYRIMECEK